MNRGDLDRLAIFPLPAVHLFPHAFLPLHIFELRYRAMVRDCIAEQRPIAVALLEPGFEADYEGRPPVRSICGVGEIVAQHPHADGRFDILLHGIGRVRVVEEHPPDRAYREVRAVALDDLYRPSLDLRAARTGLVALCERLIASLPSGGETLAALIEREQEPAALVDLLGSALITDPEVRQVLLEELDVGRRFDRLTENIAELLMRLDSRGGESLN